MNNTSRILLCFSRGYTGFIDQSPTSSPNEDEISKCRMLSRKNIGFLGQIEMFKFDSEFELNVLPLSIYTHHHTKIANYKGKFFNTNLIIKIINITYTEK